MGQGLASLLSPSRPRLPRTSEAVPFAVVSACVADAIQHRLIGIPHPSLTDLFEGPLSARPQQDDVSIASWTQRGQGGSTHHVVVVSTANDAVVYVAARPLLSIEHREALRYIADGLLPEHLLSSPHHS